MMNDLNSSLVEDRSNALGARRGITLLELLLVLSLLVIIGAMAYPTLRVPFQMQTLRKAGELVRVEWGRARIKAMKSGQIQMFTFQPNTGIYDVQPYYSEQGLLEGNASLGMSGGAVPMPQSAVAADATAVPSEALPEGVVFTSLEVDMDLREVQVQQEMQSTYGGVTNTLSAQEIPPVLFYPDGTTSDARIVLTNQYQQYYVVVSLRSLTGVVKVSDLVTADEIPTVE